MPDYSAFTKEVQDFISKNLTHELRQAGAMAAGIYAHKPEGTKWHKILNKKGWAVPSWPVEYGGTDWDLEQHAIFQRELVLARAPVLAPNAIRMVAPAIIQFGTEKQKKQYLPRIRSGDDYWAQGYSEPNSGSDLASLQCHAARKGKEYIINGTKIWTTHAHYANKIFCLVRTANSGKPQQGITFLLFDLDLEGITIRPIISASGDHEFNQVYFDNVHVPVSSVLGQENDGWSVAKYLLQHERGNTYSTRLSVKLEIIKNYACEHTGSNSKRLIDEPAFAKEVAAIEVELMKINAFEQRLFTNIKGGQSIGTLSSFNKINGTVMRQRLTELTVQAVSYYSLPYQPESRVPGSNTIPIGGTLIAATAMPQYLNDRAASIYAGSNEVQKNILAKTILGLPTA